MCIRDSSNGVYILSVSWYCDLQNNRPKTAEFRLSGSARKSQKRFRDTPRFKFQAVLARTQPFLSRSEEKRGDQSRFKCRKLSIIMQFAVPDWSALPSKTRSKLYRQNVRSKPVVRRSKLNSACLSSSESPLPSGILCWLLWVWVNCVTVT